VILVSIPPAFTAYITGRAALRLCRRAVSTAQAAHAWITRTAALIPALTSHLTAATLLVLVGRLYVRLVLGAAVALWRRTVGFPAPRSATARFVRLAVGALWGLGLWEPLHSTSRREFLPTAG